MGEGSDVEAQLNPPLYLPITWVLLRDRFSRIPHGISLSNAYNSLRGDRSRKNNKYLPSNSSPLYLLIWASLLFSFSFHLNTYRSSVLEKQPDLDVLCLGQAGKYFGVSISGPKIRRPSPCPASRSLPNQFRRRLHLASLGTRIQDLTGRRTPWGMAWYALFL